MPKRSFYICELLSPGGIDDDKENVPPHQQMPSYNRADTVAEKENVGHYTGNSKRRKVLTDTKSDNLSSTKNRTNRFVCSQCYKCFDRPSLLRRHERTHTGERPFVCNTCNKPFTTSSALNTHSRIHTGEKPHTCDQCGKTFTASSNLYYHKLTHSLDKPHRCIICFKQFSTPGDLRNHFYLHTGQWPLRCPCGRGFVKQNNLRVHLMTHLGIRPYICPLCQRRFTVSCNMKTHMATVHGVRPLLPGSTVHLPDVQTLLQQFRVQLEETSQRDDKTRKF